MVVTGSALTLGIELHQRNQTSWIAGTSKPGRLSLASRGGLAVFSVPDPPQLCTLPLRGGHPLFLCQTLDEPPSAVSFAHGPPGATILLAGLPTALNGSGAVLSLRLSSSFAVSSSSSSSSPSMSSSRSSVSAASSWKGGEPLPWEATRRMVGNGTEGFGWDVSAYNDRGGGESLLSVSFDGLGNAVLRDCAWDAPSCANVTVTLNASDPRVGFCENLSMAFLFGDGQRITPFYREGMSWRDVLRDGGAQAPNVSGSASAFACGGSCVAVAYNQRVARVAVFCYSYDTKVWRALPELSSESWASGVCSLSLQFPLLLVGSCKGSSAQLYWFSKTADNKTSWADVVTFLSGSGELPVQVLLKVGKNDVDMVLLGVQAALGRAEVQHWTATCGDGLLFAPTEECDLPTNKSTCTADCRAAPGWDCRENLCLLKDNWYCSENNQTGLLECKESVCGDHVVTRGEECDDRLFPVSGDGCSAQCKVERGWVCSALAGVPSTCTEVCGNGVVTVHERCDDNNTRDGDGCSSTCAPEPRYSCYGEPSFCLVETCGDANLTIGEACDDNNTKGGDGCSSLCKVELGYSCNNTAMPSVCTWVNCNLLFVSLQRTHCSCFGSSDGSVTINATGGAKPLFYSVSPANSSQELVFGKASKFGGLSAGTYRVVVKDVTNCFVNRTVVITQPQGVVLSGNSVTPVSCSGRADGALSLNLSMPGAQGNEKTPPCALTSFTITNLTFTNRSSWSGLLPGTYSVVVRNGGCFQTFPNFTVRTAEPLSASLASVSNTSRCDMDDGTFSLSIAGGTPPYILWFNGTTVIYDAGTRYRPGTYRFAVLDSRNCSCQGGLLSATISTPDSCRRRGLLAVLGALWLALIAAGIAVLVVVGAIIGACACARCTKAKSGAKITRNNILLVNMSKYS